METRYSEVHGPLPAAASGSVIRILNRGAGILVRLALTAVLLGFARPVPAAQASGKRLIVVLVDEGNARTYTLRAPSKGPLKTWAEQKVGAVFELGAGPHTVRFFGRSGGVRIDRFVLAPAPGR